MSWELEPTARPVNSPVDPYMDWALFDPDAGHRSFLPRGAEAYRVHLMVRPILPRRTLLDRINELPGDQKRYWKPLIKALDEWRAEPGANFITFFTDPEAAKRICGPEADGGSSFVRDAFGLLTFGPPMPVGSVAASDSEDAVPDAPEASPAAPAPPVIVGVIDDGLAFGHERFRAAAGASRFHAIWLQDGALDAPRRSVKYGREILAGEIDRWLVRSDGDEDVFYGPEGAGVIEFKLAGHKPLARSAAHGTHVLDEAFGFDAGRARTWPIIGVQLPVSVVSDSSGALLTPYAIDAVRYVERKARRLSPGSPIVVVLSYGFTAGPHDGTHPIERGIHDIVSAHNSAYPDAKMRIVIPSGNAHLDRAHACVRFAAPTAEQPNPPRSVDLPWRVQPDDTTPSFMEIWLPGLTSSRGRLSVRLTTPDGETSLLELTEGDRKVLSLTRGGSIICQVFFRANPMNHRGMFLIALQPTERIDTGPVAPAGLWTVHLRNRGFEGDAVVDAWIQRDAAPFGYPSGGRQSYFDHPDYRRFDESGKEEEEDEPACLIQRGGSMNALATGSTPIVVGGLLARELRPPKYSAGGPKPLGGAPRPSALVTSDDSRVHGGVIAAGTRSGSWVAMNGTSVAGPRIARWMAGELEHRRSANRNAVEALADREEISRPPPRPSPERGGAGRVRLAHGDEHPRHRRLETD